MTALDLPDLPIDDINKADDATTVTQELIAMRRIATRLDSLDDPARERVMRWLVARYDER